MVNPNALRQHLHRGHHAGTAGRLALQLPGSATPNSPVVITIQACKSGSFITPPRALSFLPGGDRDRHRRRQRLLRGRRRAWVAACSPTPSSMRWPATTICGPATRGGCAGRACGAGYAAARLDRRQRQWPAHPLDPGDEGVGRSLGLGARRAVLPARRRTLKLQPSCRLAAVSPCASGSRYSMKTWRPRRPGWT